MYKLYNAFWFENMKKRVLKIFKKIIRNSNKDIDEIKLEEIMYGLESIYLTLEKIVIIILISLLLGIFKEVIIFMIVYNIIRFTSFGAHAKNSIVCLIVSTITFILLPIISINIMIPNYIKIILGIVCLIIFLIYAPADTEKRPIISKSLRLFYKVSTTFIGVLYIFLSIYIKNKFYDNVLIFSLILQSIMILPITYKLFGVSYNNYKNYKIDG